MKYLKYILAIILCSSIVHASEFEELDKPPEGAHEGQMLLGGFVSIGMPFGGLIDAEDSFLLGNYYILDSGVMKELIVNHLSFDYGLSFEYMPIDHLGVKTKVRNTIIIQRTAFGSEYENFSKSLFNSYSLLLGPSFHLTVRKQWDVTLAALIGYEFGDYEATPMADRLVTGYDNDGRREISGLTMSSEINLTVYFSGGLYLSLGTEYTYHSLAFSPEYSLTQPPSRTDNANGRTYTAGSGGDLHTVNIVISAGYAFSN